MDYPSYPHQAGLDNCGLYRPSNVFLPTELHFHLYLAKLQVIITLLLLVTLISTYSVQIVTPMGIMFVKPNDLIPSSAAWNEDMLKWRKASVEDKENILNILNSLKSPIHHRLLGKDPTEISLTRLRSWSRLKYLFRDQTEPHLRLGVSG